MFTTGTTTTFRRAGALLATTVAFTGLAGLTTPATAASTAATPRVVKADIDGDGRTDRLTVTRTGERTWQMKVRTARGRTSTTTHRWAQWSPVMADDAYFGAARIDGVAGREVVMRIGYGAHTPWYAVYSWRKGKLVKQNAPASPGAPASDEWAVDSALNYGGGYSRYIKNGRTHLVVSIGDRNQPGTGYTLQKETYRWSNGSWRYVSRTSKQVTERQARATFGWNITGLRRDV